MDVVADGVGDRGDHFGVEHQCCGAVFELDEGFFDVERGDAGELFDLVWELVTCLWDVKGMYVRRCRRESL